MNLFASNEGANVGPGLVEVFVWVVLGMAAIDAIGFCARVLGWI